MDPFHWVEGGTVTLAATAASGNVALTKMPTGTVQLRVVNEGPNTAYIKKGTDNTVAAATTDMPIPSGAVEVLTLRNNERAPITHIAAICGASKTATLSFTVGAGI